MPVIRTMSKPFSFRTILILRARYCSAVRDEFNLMAVVLNPDSSRTTPVDLRNAATYVRRIRKITWNQHSCPNLD